MKRLIVTEDITTIDSDSIANFIDSLRRATGIASEKGYTNVRVEVRRYEEPYSDWVSAECAVVGQRPETDEELAKRVNAEDAWKARRREEYERMKKEFGDA